MSPLLKLDNLPGQQAGESPVLAPSLPSLALGDSAPSPGQEEARSERGAIVGQFQGEATRATLGDNQGQPAKTGQEAQDRADPPANGATLPPVGRPAGNPPPDIPQPRRPKTGGRKPRPTVEGFAPTKEAVEHATGLSGTTIARWLAQPDCPPREGDKGWPIQAVREFISRKQRENITGFHAKRNTNPDIEKEKLRKIRLENKLLETKIAHEERKLISMAEHLETVGQITGIFVSSFETLYQTAKVTFTGAGFEKALPILENLLDNERGELADKIDNLQVAETKEEIHVQEQEANEAGS